MNHAQAFIGAFALVAVLTVLGRVAIHKDPPPTPAASHDDPQREEESGKPRVPRPAAKVPGQSVGEIVELNNTVDPTSGKPIDPARALTSDYLGHRVRLGSEESRKEFARSPVQYLMKLNLEVTRFDRATRKPTRLKRVDASTYRTIALERCRMTLGMKIDPKRGVYVLHRGFKIHFC